MSDSFMNVLIFVLGAFFFGLLFYGFYIVLRPAPKEKRAKKNSRFAR